MLLASRGPAEVKPELADAPLAVSLPEFAAPESRFCPAKVSRQGTRVDGVSGVWGGFGMCCLMS